MDRSNLYNIIHLSISFIFIFISYGVAQTFQTSSDYAKHGAFAVGIIYLVFCLGNLVLSSYFTQILGVKLTLILSSLTYVSFIAANIKYNPWVLYITAFLLGLGAAFIWTAQGVYVAVSISQHERINNLISSSTQGFLNGIFFGLFQCSVTIGNLFASILFHFKYDQWIIFTVMTIIAIIGTICFIFIRPVQIPKDTKKKSILATIMMLREISFLVLIPTMCYSGLSGGFIFSALPPLIIDKSRKFLIFAVCGVVSSCSSILFGKLSDYLGRLLIFGIGALSHFTMYGLLLIIWKPPLDQNRIDIFVIMIICLSVGDTIFGIQLFSILSIFYGETRPAEAFACFKVFQAGCSAIGFIAQVYCPFSVQLFYLIIFLSLSFITLTYENYSIISLDTGKTIMALKEQNGNKIETKNEVEILLTTLPTTTGTIT